MTTQRVDTQRLMAAATRQLQKPLPPDLKIQIDINAEARLLELRFPYDQALVERVKQLDGRKWNADARCWTVPAAQVVSVIEQLGDLAEPTPTVYDAFLQERARRLTLDTTRKQLDTDLELPLAVPLWGYQKVGVKFVMQAGFRALIADDVGLGKTPQAIAVAMVERDRTLVLCPAAVKINWRKKIRWFLGLQCAACAEPDTRRRNKEGLVHTCATLYDGQGQDGSSDNQFHVTNFETFIKRRAEFEAMGFTLLVIDEAHYLTNKDAKRTLAVFGGTAKVKTEENGKQVVKKRPVLPFIVPKCVMLTATPVNNRPAELFPLVNYLDPGRFPSFWTYGNRYGAFAPGNQSGLPSTPRNLDELHTKIGDIVIRRLEQEVNADRPRAIEDELWLELSPAQRREYNKLMKELLGDWAEKGKPTLAAMHPLREFLIQAKLPLVWDTIQELNDAGKGVVMFATRIDPLVATQARFGKNTVLIDGSMSLVARQRSIDAIENGRALNAVISIRAGGTGIDGLQHKIHHGIFLDMDWVPALHHQAKGRIDRTGQRFTVRMLWAMVEGTVDEYLRQMHATKEAVTGAITDGAVRKKERKRSFFKSFVTKLKRDYKKELARVADADDEEGGITDNEGAV